MNKGKYVFSQLIGLISSTSFSTCVNRYDGHYKVKHFSCWKQFLCMCFGQLTHRESLSDAITCLNAHRDKLYHLGIGGQVTKSTLSRANESRDWRIFRDFASLLIQEAKELYLGDSNLEIELQNNVFAIDATIIDLCLNTFSWATFRKTKAAVKIHSQLDLKTSIPVFAYITPADVHEVNFLDILQYEPNSFYVMDRGYVDFKRLYRIHQSSAYFVVRCKENLDFKRIKSNPCDKSTGVLCDQIIKLVNFYPLRDYPIKLRRVKFYDIEQERVLIFLTNNFEFSASVIAQLYKHRWKIELFFKWIKQHLKIQSFWGQSANAVKTQIWIAISVYVLVAIAKKRFSINHSLYEILQIISIGIFERMPINSLFQPSTNQHFKELYRNQLNIFD